LQRGFSILQPRSRIAIVILQPEHQTIFPIANEKDFISDGGSHRCSSPELLHR
jgi:hypothetical protein